MTKKKPRKELGYYCFISLESNDMPLPLKFKIIDNLEKLGVDLTPNFHSKNCKVCEKPFISKRSDTMYCSDACNTRYLREKNKFNIFKLVDEYKIRNK